MLQHTYRMTSTEVAALPNAGPDEQTSLSTVLSTVKMMLSEGWRNEARSLLHVLVASNPTFVEPWFQLLALDPTPAEEIELLEGFLRHHPQHHFAPAFRNRLADMEIISLLRENNSPAAAGAALGTPRRLGDYLVARGWVSREQIDAALGEQGRLRACGVEERLGTLLLREGHLCVDQLAAAIAETPASGFGEFGNYLVREGLVTAAQVSAALAYQSEQAARNGKWHVRALGRSKPVPRLGEVLVSMGVLTAEQVSGILREREKVFHASFG